jgi:hypothetical protein
VHARSLTPQAKYNFLATSKSENHMRNGFTIEQNGKGMHNGRKIRAARAAIKGNMLYFISKTYVNCPTPLQN